MNASVPSDDSARLAALRDYALLETPPEAELDAITRLAAQICDTPMALITLLDDKRQWFKSNLGLDVPETPLESAFCRHALGGTDLLVVPDATQDDRFAANPLVTGSPGIRFYAGAPLCTPTGAVLGTLCVLDRRPRELNAGQLQALQTLSHQVMRQFEYRRELRQSRRATMLLNGIVNGIPDALYVRDLKGQFLLMNLSGAAMTGHRLEQADAPAPQAAHGENAAARDELDTEVMNTGMPMLVDETLTVHGQARHYMTTKAPFRDESGDLQGVVAISRDVTARTRENDKLQRLQRLYAVSSSINAVLMHIHEPGQVYDQACRIAVERGGLRLAWVGLLREGSTDFEIVASHGKTAGFLDLVRVSTLPGQPEGNGPSGTAYRENRCVCCNDIAADPAFQPWREHAQAQGLASCAAFPLAVAGEVIGVYTVYSGQRHYFDTEELHLLSALASNISFAVEAHHREILQHEAEQSRREADQRFQEMADSIGEIFYSFDVIQQKLLFANKAYERLWGLPMHTVYENPLSYLDAVHPEDYAAAAGAFEQQLQGRPTNVEFRVTRPDGEQRWVHEHAVPVLNSAGVLERIVGTMRDITDSKTNAEQIRDSEERFRLLAHATNEIIWDWDIRADRHWWNDRAQSLLGCDTPPAFEDWRQHLHEQDREAVLSSLQAALDGGAETWSAEYRLLTADGVHASIQHRGHIKRHPDGTALRMTSGLADCTAQREAEARLREQATFLDKAQDAILVRDLSHRITYCNRSAERLYGWTAEELLGQPVYEKLYTDNRAYHTATDHTLHHGEWTGELQQYNREGQQLTVEGRWTLVRDEQGQPKSILAINTDITERKRLEQQFLRAQRMESIGTLAGGIAHDLNNILAPILMSIELLKMDTTPESLRKNILDTIEMSARRGADMVRQVLSFARGMNGAQLEVSIARILGDVEKITRETFPKNIQTTCRIADGLWSVYGDPTQLHQVLLNLCVNARDAMGHGGSLRLRAENITLDETCTSLSLEARPGKHVLVEVADTGTGMTPEVVERIFEPFFTTKEVGKGTGLGLSTTLAIVKSHHGFLRVLSDPGKGSRFLIYLPAFDEEEDEAAGDDPEAMDDEVPDLPQGRGECILVVDDEDAVRDITRQTLESFGYHVLIAANGTDAMALYASHWKHISAVITDMMMPEMDGPAVIRAVRRINPQARIIAASGLNATHMVAKAAKEGVRHFIPKPYPAEKLLCTLREVLDAPAM